MVAVLAAEEFEEAEVSQHLELLANFVGNVTGFSSPVALVLLYEFLSKGAWRWQKDREAGTDAQRSLLMRIAAGSLHFATTWTKGTRTCKQTSLPGAICVMNSRGLGDTRGAYRDSTISCGDDV
jgi:hypothetical protein